VEKCDSESKDYTVS